VQKVRKAMTLLLHDTMLCYLTPVQFNTQHDLPFSSALNRKVHIHFSCKMSLKILP